MALVFLSTPSVRRATCPFRVSASANIISIHALREEGDTERPLFTRSFQSFLSTPSARRATGVTSSVEQGVSISIHALREEGDRRCSKRSSTRSSFYPRPPRGGRRIEEKYMTERLLFLCATRSRLNQLSGYDQTCYSISSSLLSTKQLVTAVRKRDGTRVAPPERVQAETARWKR